MFLPFSSFDDPALQRIHLGGREMLASFQGWHPVILIARRDTRDEGTLGNITRHNGMVARFKFCERAFLLIKAQASLAFVLVRPVTRVAVLRKDWPDVAVEIDLWSRLGF